MYANKLIAVILMGLAGTVAAQSIDEISNLNRLKVVKELRDKTVGVEKSGAAGANGMPTMGAQGAMPGMPLSGSVPMPIAAPVKVEPMLMGIYGVGSALVAELQEDGYTSQYREGDMTAGGWTVRRINGMRVDLTKGKGKKPKTVSLTFGSKVDVPKEAANSPIPGMMSMPGMIPPPMMPPGGMLPASLSSR